MNRTELVDYLTILKAYESMQYELNTLYNPLNQKKWNLNSSYADTERNLNSRVDNAASQVKSMENLIAEVKKAKEKHNTYTEQYNKMLPSKKKKTAIGLTLILIAVASMAVIFIMLLISRFVHSSAFTLTVFLLMAVSPLITTTMLVVGAAFLASIKAPKQDYNVSLANRNIEELESQLKKYQAELLAKEKERKQVIQQEAEKKNTGLIQVETAINENTSKLSYIGNKLKALYAFNEIPLQFRNFEGVNYLADFMSTSELSLGEAIAAYQHDKIIDSINSLKNQLHDDFNHVIGYQMVQIQQQHNNLCAISSLGNKVDEMNNNVVAFQEKTASELSKVASNTSDLSKQAAILEQNLQAQKDMTASMEWRDSMRYYYRENYF